MWSWAKKGHSRHTLNYCLELNKKNKTGKSRTNIFCGFEMSLYIKWNVLVINYSCSYVGILYTIIALSKSLDSNVKLSKFLCLLHLMLSLFHSLLLRSHSNLMQQARIITRRISYKFKYTYIYAKEKDKNKGLHSKTCKWMCVLCDFEWVSWNVWEKTYDYIYDRCFIHRSPTK